MALVEYIYWHYGVAPANIVKLLKNYMVGTWHRFLISTHFRTLLAPWHRANPSDAGKPQNFGDKIINAVIDFYIRIVAAIVRLIIILVGLISEVLVFAVFVLLLIFWFLWPLIFIYLISKGLLLIL
jgi:hypothetical protein